MSWKDIFKEGNRICLELDKILGDVDPLHEFQPSDLGGKTICGKKIVSGKTAGIHCFFFPITPTVGLKIMPTNTELDVEKSLRYWTHLMRQSCAPHIYHIDKHYSNLLAIYCQIATSSNEFGHTTDKDIYDKFHAKIKRIERGLKEKFKKIPFFMIDLSCENIGFINGKFVIIDTNVSRKDNDYSYLLKAD
jgi:hypothetical protein